MRGNSPVLSILSLAFAVGGCVEPYVPAVLEAPTSFLVVEGFINGNGVTRVQLSRTATIAATTTPPVEKGAKVVVFDDMGGRYNLTEKPAGAYQSDSLVLPTGRQYQVRITTMAGATYASAFVPLKVTPPIDKLTWKLTSSDITFALSTHDPTQQARYYRWRTTETWQFNALYHSNLEYQDGIIQGRTTPIYTCWRTEANTTIRQGSSAQLSQDALTDVRLLSFPYLTERFKVRYSVLVSQVAQTAEEFAYYEQLRKNTEAVGTVNDPLPTQLTGNVHRTDANPSEPVLGFVGAHTVQQKRLFVARQELPTASDEQFESPYRACTIGKEILKDTLDPRFTLYYPDTRVFAFAGNIPLDFIIYPDIPNGTPRIQGYTGSSAYCADCRTRGTATKPIFW